MTGFLCKISHFGILSSPGLQIVGFRHSFFMRMTLLFNLGGNVANSGSKVKMPR